MPRIPESAATVGLTRISAQPIREVLEIGKAITDNIGASVELTSTAGSGLAAIVTLSRTYCGMIRRGVRVPHPRHWEALRELVSPPEP